VFEDAFASSANAPLMVGKLSRFLPVATAEISQNPYLSIRCRIHPAQSTSSDCLGQYIGMLCAFIFSKKAATVFI
jgi:hypothetical protein